MSRWRQDPNGAAAELVRRSLSSLDLAGRCLLANAGGLVADALREGGVDVTAWSRRASDVTGPKPWPIRAPTIVRSSALPSLRTSRR